MQTFYFEKILELKKAKNELEKALNIEISIEGKKVIIEGSSIEEYEATKVLDAINFGFSAKKAIVLKEDTMDFKIINIKNFSKKKDLKTVRGRIIGSKGRTKKTIENITGCNLVIKENEMGIICSVDSIDEVMTAIENLIRGTKQSNTYRYLEKMNKKEFKD